MEECVIQILPDYMAARSVQTKIEFGSIVLMKCLGPTFSSSHLRRFMSDLWKLKVIARMSQNLGPFWLFLPSLFSAGLSKLKWKIKWCDRRELPILGFLAHPLPWESWNVQGFHIGSVWWRLKPWDTQRLLLGIPVSVPVSHRWKLCWQEVPLEQLGEQWNV